MGGRVMGGEGKDLKRLSNGKKGTFALILALLLSEFAFLPSASAETRPLRGGKRVLQSQVLH